MQFLPIQSFTRKRLSDVVSDQIKQLISDGTLMPGDRLPAERDLAMQLGVSRPSLREALIRLEADGYIETSGRGGFTVVDVTAPIISKTACRTAAAESAHECRYSRVAPGAGVDFDGLCS